MYGRKIGLRVRLLLNEFFPPDDEVPVGVAERNLRERPIPSRKSTDLDDHTPLQERVHDEKAIGSSMRYCLLRATDMSVVPVYNSHFLS